MMKIILLYLLTLLFFSTSTIYCQNGKLENSKKTFWQLTYSSDTNINNMLIKNINYGKLIFKKSHFKQYLNEDTLVIENYKIKGTDSLIIQFFKLDNRINKRIFLKSGSYHYKIEYRTLFLTGSDNNKFQFYEYNTDEIKESQKKKDNYPKFPKF
jgi:hypothetical protein